MRPIWKLLGVVVLAGCGSSSRSTGDMATSHDLSMASVADLAGQDLAGRDLAKTIVDMTSAADMVAATYPPAPYGNKVGDTFPLLMWQGYVDFNADAVATTKAFGPFSMDGVRTSGRAYAMIHVADYT